jgi:hypothetical protein
MVLTVRRILTREEEETSTTEIRISKIEITEIIVEEIEEEDSITEQK